MIVEPDAPDVIVPPTIAHAYVAPGCGGADASRFCWPWTAVVMVVIVASGGGGTTNSHAPRPYAATRTYAPRGAT